MDHEQFCPVRVQGGGFPSGIEFNAKRCVGIAHHAIGYGHMGHIFQQGDREGGNDLTGIGAGRNGNTDFQLDTGRNLQEFCGLAESESVQQFLAIDPDVHGRTGRIVNDLQSGRLGLNAQDEENCSKK